MGPIPAVASECDTTQLVPVPDVEHSGHNLEYINESCIKVIARSKPAKHSNPSVPAPSDIERYLMRPAMVVQGTIPAASAAIVASWEYNRTNLFVQSQWAVKLREHLAIRSSIIATVNISATPFHSGVLRLVWQPFDLAYAGSIRFPRNFRQTLYTLPGVTFNLSDTTQVVLKVPWLNNVPYLDIGAEASAQADPYAPGRFVLYNLTDVTPPEGTVAPTFTMFMHHEDVVVLGPAPVSWSSVQPQGLKEDLAETKAISTVLSIGAKAAYALGKIPLLPQGLDTVGWVLTKAAGAVAMFGFSKPLANVPLTRTYPARGAFDTHATGGDPATALSLLHDAGVPVASVAGTDVDEQSVAYVASVPGMLADFTVTTQPGETLVWACALSPSSMYFQNGRVMMPARERISSFNTAPFPAILPTPVFGLSTLSAYWNGSFDFEFFMSKTKFHTGRLAFVFVPGSASLSYNVNIGAGNHAYPSFAATASLDRQIVDIRTTTTFRMNCPYVHNQTMCPQQGFYGYLCVYVVEPIRAPSTVTPGVRLIATVSSPDFKMGGVTGVTWAPTNNDNAVFAQSYTEDLGEEITSLNQVAKRTCFRLASAGTSGVQPFAQNLPVYTPTPLAPTACLIGNVDLTDFIRAAYVLERGGMIVTSYQGVLRTRTVAVPFAASGAIVDRLGFNERDASYMDERDPNQPRTRVYVPRYCPASAYKTDQGGVVVLDFVAREYGRIPPSVVNQVANASNVNQNYENGRCVADDHMFALFVGWPPLTRGSAFF